MPDTTPPLDFAAQAQEMVSGWYGPPGLVKYSAARVLQEVLTLLQHVQQATREAVMPWLRHGPSCLGPVLGAADHPGCTCGLAAALRGEGRPG